MHRVFACAKCPVRARPDQRLLEVAEFNIAVFALLLHFAWEMLHAVLYKGTRDAPYMEVLFIRGRATLGDVVIVLTAFWAVAGRARAGRHWLLSPARLEIARFTLIVVLITVIVALLSTRLWHRWSYGDFMPVVPLLDVGLSPLLQWLILSPLIVWFVHRQIT